ncbi:MAG: hypothetical protein LAP21_00245 [Acidobacteriia bacterium]|nr:hypothetical protein [Terriglobia bacterium]
MGRTDGGTLTDDMARLHDEITSLRDHRQELQHELLRHHKSARKAVQQMLADFSEARHNATRKARQHRLAMVKGLRHDVAEQRQAVQSDLAGVRTFWTSKSA